MLISNVDFPEDFASLHPAKQIPYKFLSFLPIFQSLLFLAMLLKGDLSSPLLH